MEERKALMAALSARDGSFAACKFPFERAGASGGGGGAVGMVGAVRMLVGGGRGAAEGGGGGAEGGRDAGEEGGGRGGAVGIVAEGFRPAGGGIGGFFPIGGGGLGFDGIVGMLCMLAGEGLEPTPLLKAAAAGPNAGGAEGGGSGGAPPGGRAGIPFDGGTRGVLTVLRAALVSGSESSMFTPPAFFRSFGIPPAKMPPNCGALSIPVAVEVGLVLPWSLLLRARVWLVVGGRRPGTGGAPPVGAGAAEDALPFATIGAERSLVTAFFRRAPFAMSPSRPGRP